MYCRVGLGRGTVVYESGPADFAFGKATRLRDGRDITIVTMGTELRPTLDAAAVLAGEGIAARVVDMHTLKPIDAAEIRAAAAERSEEHTSELQSLMRISYAVFCLKKKNIDFSRTHSDKTIP